MEIEAGKLASQSARRSRTAPGSPGFETQQLEPAPHAHPPSFTWRAVYGFSIGLQLLIVGLLLDFLLLPSRLPWLEGPPSIVVRMLLLAGLVLAFARGYAWLLLLGFQISLLFSEHALPAFRIGWGTCGYALLLFGLLAYSLRFSIEGRALAEWIAARIAYLTSSGHHTGHASSARHSPSWVYSWLVRACNALALSMWLLTLLPLSREVSDQLLQRSLSGHLSLVSAAWLVVAALALWIIIQEAAWRQLTSDQARIYLRSTFLVQHFRDLRSIVRRCLKAGRRSPSNSSK